MYNKMKALYLYKLNKNKAKIHLIHTPYLFLKKQSEKSCCIFCRKCILLRSKWFKFIWCHNYDFPTHKYELHMRTGSFCVFTDSFYWFLFVYGELTCVVLKCVSYQDTVRLEGLVPLQVDHVCVPLNPKVLWSPWLYERIMKAVHILILDTNVTYLTSDCS